MKNLHNFFPLITIPGLVSWMVLFLYSCDTYNFVRPQPSGKENIYEFPKDFQGSWILDQDGGSVTFRETNLEYVIKRYTEKIASGAWPRLNAKGDFVFSPFANDGMKSIRYDSLKRPIDTTDNYIQRGNYIYHLDSHALPEKGYPYFVNRDTLLVPVTDTMVLDLGRNAFLRKLNNNFYVFNINNSILSDLDMGGYNGWWQVIIFEEKNNSLINIWYQAEKITRQPCMFYDHDGNYYFDCEWTAGEIMQLIKDGGFRVGNKLIRPKEIGLNN